MIAYSRGSQRLAGAASLKYGVPAIVGAFSCHLDIAHWLEQQPSEAVGSGFKSRYPNR
jgi:hypothetical protein